MRLPPEKTDKLPRNHAYVHMRNRGYSIHIDFREVDSEIAEKMIKAAMAAYDEAMGKGKAK